MRLKLCTVLALCLLLFSCKKEDKTAETEAATPTASGPKKMVVEMNVLQKTPDIYAVYYTEDNTLNFNTEHVIWNEVKPSETEQTLRFELPEAAFPTHIRFDIGNKPEREDVTLTKFKLTYADKTLEVKGADFFKYFHGNDSIPTAVDPSKGAITFVKKPGSKHIPYFNPNDTFVAEIAKLMK